MKPILTIVAVILTFSSGCAVLPTGVEPLPYYQTSNKAQAIKSLELCRLYRKYGFTIEDCRNSNDWSVKPLGKEELDSEEIKHRRNELQEEIIGLATSKCNEFKKTITAQSKKTLLGAETSSLMLSGGATVVGPVIIAKSLAAGAAATTGFGGLIDEGYTKI